MLITWFSILDTESIQSMQKVEIHAREDDFSIKVIASVISIQWTKKNECSLETF